MSSNEPGDPLSKGWPGNNELKDRSQGTGASEDATLRPTLKIEKPRKPDDRYGAALSALRQTGFQPRHARI